MHRRVKHTSITIDELLGNGVFYWGNLRLYNEEPRPTEAKLREPLEILLKDD
jgi:hypothetical protein